jgi:hypothetical protein
MRQFRWPQDLLEEKVWLLRCTMTEGICRSSIQRRDRSKLPNNLLFVGRQISLIRARAYWRGYRGAFGQVEPA